MNYNMQAWALAATVALILLSMALPEKEYTYDQKAALSYTL